MSAYKGHRGPNVSQYIANLNQLSPPQGPLDESATSEEDFSAFLSNDFFDIDNNPIPNFDAPLDLDVDVAAAQLTQPSLGNNSRKHSIQTSADPSMEFNLNGDFQFTDFNNFGPTALLDPSMQGLPQPQPTHYALPPTYASPASSISLVTQGFDQAAKKRKLDSGVPETPHESLDENVRVAAEEDKRRRNTAASARFRVKKKQREQALEQTAKEMQDKATRLEQKVQQLETENAWLKSLITEKNGGTRTTSDLKALLSKHEETVNRSSGNNTDGVGTKA